MSESEITMFTKALPRLTGVLGASAALIFGATPALAASSGGAEVFRVNGCQYFGTTTICGRITEVIQFVELPNGDQVGARNSAYDYTVTYGTGYSQSDQGTYHAQILIKQGETKEFSYHFSDVIVSPTGLTCTYEYDEHYANGQQQFLNYTFTCI